MQNKHSLEHLSQQIEINPLDIHSLQRRSEILTIEGRYDQAISDCTKLIHLDMSRQHYVKRSQLFNSNRQYLDALRDLSIAKQMQKQEEEETASDVYLQNSVCMKCITEVEELTQLTTREKDESSRRNYQKTIQQLLVVQEIQKKQLNDYKKQIQQLKKFYQEQTDKFLAVIKQQLGEVRVRHSQFYINYQHKFEQQLASSKLPQEHIDKLQLYFRCFASEMEKYYIAAKNLHKIEDKTIKFQDLEKMLVDKNNSSYLNKLYKLFDKYGAQVQKLEQIIEHIPYIGTTFKVVKAVMKIHGWKEQINIENQCRNIEDMAINTTTFNDFSTNLAYYAAKYYQQRIIEQKESYTSNWQLLAKKIKDLKDKKLGKLQYKKQLTAQEEIVRDYAIIHASILMIGYACRQVTFKPENIKNINKLYENSQKQAFQQMNKIFSVIDKVESVLKQKTQKQNTPEQPSPSASSSYCIIY